MSAEIINLCERRAGIVDEPVLDLVTAVDVAIRDLREIQEYWGSEAARQRVMECERMLEQALAQA